DLCVSKLGEVPPGSRLHRLLHDGSCAISISLGLFAEGQGHLCLQDDPPIAAPFAACDPFLQESGCLLQMVPFVLELPPAHIGRTRRREVSTPLQSKLERLAIRLICLVQMSLEFLHTSQVMRHQKDPVEMI